MNNTYCLLLTRTLYLQFKKKRFCCAIEVVTSNLVFNMQVDSYYPVKSGGDVLHA